MTQEPHARWDADERGWFGDFGGRYMPEALVAALDELTDAWQEAWADDAFRADFDAILRDYANVPSPLYERERLSEHIGGARILLKREDLNHTGAHKIRNVLGPGAADQADGQAAGDRRDRRRPARRRRGHRGGVLRARLHRLHGLGRHPPPGAQRRADAAARREGRARRLRQRHPQGRHQRGAARLGGERRPHRLPVRYGGRAPPVPEHGARLHPRHRRRGPRPVPRADRPAARRRDRLRRRRLQRDRAVHRVPRRPRRRDPTASRRAATGSRPVVTPRPSRPGRAASSTVPARSCSRTRTARPSSPTRSRPASTTPASARSTPTSPSPAAPTTCRSPTARRWMRSSCSPARRASSRPSSRRTPWPVPIDVARELGPERAGARSTCPAAATRTWRPRWSGSASARAAGEQ